jgi:5-methylcytosine-specific restriction endonuclease McrA
MKGFNARPGKRLNGKQRFNRLVVLRARDGGACFYCLEPLGSDETLEHLVERQHRGSNHPDNLVIAHEACNFATQGLSVDQKMLLRGDALLAQLAGEKVPGFKHLLGMGWAQAAEFRRQVAAIGAAA